MFSARLTRRIRPSRSSAGAFGMPFCVLLFRAFVSAIPRELDEAAILDGCSGFSLYFRVIFPLLRPVTITVIRWPGSSTP